MPSMPREYRTEREGLSPAEKAKQDRRLARAIQDGIPIGILMRRYAVTQTRVRKVAEQCGLEIAKAKRGTRW